MRRAHRWFKQYSNGHKSDLNLNIHVVGIPVAYWSILAILWALPRSSFMYSPFVNWATIALMPTLLFYFSLGTLYFFQMLIFSMTSFIFIMLMTNHSWPVGWIGLVTLTAAWSALYYGHKTEENEHEFLTDLKMIVLGPLWIIHILTNSSTPKVVIKKDVENYVSPRERWRSGRFDE